MTDDLQNLLAGMVCDLEWNGKNGFWRAKTADGALYEILEVYDEFHLHIGKVSAQYPTLEAAKSAAQADYTARILAALDPDALARMLADARAEGLEVALGAIAAIPTPAIEDQARGREDAYRAVEAIRAMKGGQP